ncbi:MAG TPA: hypothetical protein VLE99_02605 [Candidatus Saccharimonadales bacterium]|nr:hypothetical protein [Candidatus Saccharimonadales bacterium]
MNAQLSELMDKEVSRKEFLGMAGLAVASILGFGTVLKAVTGRSFGTSRQMVSGYGAMPYGGGKEQ